MALRQNAPYADRITADPEIMTGKAVIKGTRIPVELVLGFLAEKPDLAELFAAYPHLTVADVQACLAYARTLVARQCRRPRPAAAPRNQHASA